MKQLASPFFPSLSRRVLKIEREVSLLVRASRFSYILRQRAICPFEFDRFIDRPRPVLDHDPSILSRNAFLFSFYSLVSTPFLYNHLLLRTLSRPPCVWVHRSSGSSSQIADLIGKTRGACRLPSGCLSINVGCQ